LVEADKFFLLHEGILSQFLLEALNVFKEVVLLDKQEQYSFDDRSGLVHFLAAEEELDNIFSLALLIKFENLFKGDITSNHIFS